MTILLVKLNGKIIGEADSWKEAELIAGDALMDAHKPIPAWTARNTRETPEAFQFFSR